VGGEFPKRTGQIWGEIHPNEVRLSCRCALFGVLVITEQMGRLVLTGAFDDSATENVRPFHLRHAVENTTRLNGVQNLLP
jgi:hypothetical protein